MIKPVSLNEEKDKDIIEYVEALDVTFASYVRDLIRKDMNKTDAPEKKSEVSELVDTLKVMINTNNMMMGQLPQMMMQMMGQMQTTQSMQVTQTVEKPIEPPKPEVSDVQKKAVNNIMNRFKK